MRRGAALLAAGVLVGVAVVLALLAFDVRTWDRTIAAADARFRTDPAPVGLWEASEVLPFEPARKLLDVDDDLEYRRGARLFRLGRPREPVLGFPRLPAFRAEAEAVLGAAAQREQDPVRKAQVLNLLGILALARAAEEEVQTANLLRESISILRRAVATDPTSEEVKTNLELVLRLRLQRVQEEESSSRRTGEAEQVGLGRAGSGY
jgi:hypothetical protein